MLKLLGNFRYFVFTDGNHETDVVCVLKYPGFVLLVIKEDWVLNLNLKKLFQTITV